MTKMKENPHEHKNISPHTMEGYLFVQEKRQCLGCFSACLFTCLGCFSACLFTCLSIDLPGLFFCLSVYLPVCLPVLSVDLSSF